jgi:hypothetical protein
MHFPLAIQSKREGFCLSDNGTLQLTFTRKQLENDDDDVDDVDDDDQ